MKQKKWLALVISILLVTTLLLVACVEKDTAYVITFETNGGAAIDAVTVNAGESTELPVPLKEGYSFDGWFADKAFTGQPLDKIYTPKKNETLYAKWTKKEIQTVEYLVIFETNGGGNIDEMKVKEGDSIVLPTPTAPLNSKLVFAGWYNNEDFSGEAVVSPFVPNGNTTLYAKWAKETFIIAFNVNGGIEIKSISVEVGESVSLPCPEKEGFGFEGWFIEENFSGTAVTSPYTPTGNVTLNAKWGNPKYVITLEGGAAAKFDPIEVEVGGAVTLPEPTADGYEFEGWYMSENFEGVAITSPYTPNGDITLFAKWTLLVTEEKYFKFTPDSTGKFASVAASDAKPYPEILVIPAEYNGMAVNEIDRNGFSNQKTLKKIIFPEGMTTINFSSFYGCTSLESITIPKSLQEISGGAFNTCTKLKHVFYNGTVEDWCKIEFANLTSQPLSNYGALYIDNTVVTDVTIPDSVTELKEYTFASTPNLNKVTLPSNLTKINGWVFYNCRNLKEISLPDSLENIGTKAFVGTKVSKIEKGVKYIGKWAIGYDSMELNTTLQIRPGTVGIAYGAFENCDKITETTIPGTIKIIDTAAFRSCSSLVRVTVEKGVEVFGYEAFEGCSSIKEFYYTGTLADWFCLKLDEGGDSTPLFYAETFYIQGEPIVDLVIPSEVTEINRMAFQGYKGLKSVVIPNSVTVANAQIFLYCENLTDIWCEVSAKPAAWHSNWRGDHGVTATVHWGDTWEYVDGKPTLKTA